MHKGENNGCIEDYCGRRLRTVGRRWRRSTAARRSKPPAFVVSEIAVRDQKGYDENFLKATQKDIASHGGKYLAGGLDKTVSLVGNPPPNRVVILQFPNMDAVKAWRDEGAMDMENTVGNKYAAFRIYAVDGVTP